MCYKQQNQMAFVINKSEYKSVFEQRNNHPGPGAYQRAQPFVQDIPAPFNASSSKQSCFVVKQSNLGPGSYQNFSMHQRLKTKTTCATGFKSEAPRFPYQRKRQSTQIDAPLHYQSQKSLLFYQNTQNSQKDKFHVKKLKEKKEYLNQLRQHNQQRKTNSITSGEKGKVRILLTNPKNTENVESFYIDQLVNIKQGNCPGDYDVSKSFVEKNKSVIDWSKDKQKRFKKSLSTAASPGPGYYELNKRVKSSHHKRLTPSFSSGEVRSFIDNIVYRTNSLAKAEIMQSNGLKQRSPGPGDYSPQKPQKGSFNRGKQIMSSTVQRFGTSNNKAPAPGPGYYKNSDCKYKYQGMVKQMRQKIFGKHGSLAKEQKEGEEFLSLQKEMQSLKPDKNPDYHQVIPCSLKDRCQSKAGTISHEKRFNDTSKSRVPGPGQYLNVFQKRCPLDTSGIFKSGTERQPYVISKESAQKPFYEVGKEDIAFRTQKVKQNIRSLQKVAIQKPAFDSSVQRFVENQPHKLQSSKTLSQSVSYERDQIDYNSFKPYKEKTECASVFRSTTNRQPFVLKNNPGPGSYEYLDLLNKKSFNSYYYHEEKRKVVSTSKLEIK